MRTSSTAFSVAVIAPFGLEDLLHRAANIRGRSAAIAGVIGAVFVVGWAILVSGWTFFETGVDLVEADRDPSPRVAITLPEHGTKHNGLQPLVIRGHASGEVEQVRATLDKFFVGDKRTAAKGMPMEAGGEVPEIPPLQRINEYPPEARRSFTRYFDFSYAMDTVDEGAYKIAVAPFLEGPEEIGRASCRERV